MHFLYKKYKIRKDWSLLYFVIHTNRSLPKIGEIGALNSERLKHPKAGKGSAAAAFVHRCTSTNAYRYDAEGRAVQCSAPQLVQIDKDILRFQL